MKKQTEKMITLGEVFAVGQVNKDVKFLAANGWKKWRIEKDTKGSYVQAVRLDGNTVERWLCKYNERGELFPAAKVRCIKTLKNGNMIFTLARR
jgi:hypothetical protein